MYPETEKYAHVTFFFNGGLEKPWPQEDRFMEPSPKVATYDLQPTMSADGVAKQVCMCTCVHMCMSVCVHMCMSVCVHMCT